MLVSLQLLLLMIVIMMTVKKHTRRRRRRRIMLVNRTIRDNMQIFGIDALVLATHKRIGQDNETTIR